MIQSIILKFLVLSSLLILCYCASDVTVPTDEGGTTETTCFVFLKNGDPATNVEVLFVPAEFKALEGDTGNQTTLQDTIYKTHTNDTGKYYIPNLKVGKNYNIHIADGSVRAYRHNVTLRKIDDTTKVLVTNGDTLSKVIDTLRETGIITGVARLQPEHDHSKIIVLVLGSNVYAKTDSSGKFTIPNLAAGKYELEFLTTAHSEYSDTSIMCTVTMLNTTKIKDTIYVPFKGFKLPQLTVSYSDTSMAASLHWKFVCPPELSNQFKCYKVVRKIKGSDHPETFDIPGTDTTFIDTCGYSNGPLPGNCYLYSVEAQCYSFTDPGKTVIYESKDMSITFSSLYPVVDSVRIDELAGQNSCVDIKVLKDGRVAFIVKDSSAIFILSQNLRSIDKVIPLPESQYPISIAVESESCLWYVLGVSINKININTNKLLYTHTVAATLVANYTDQLLFYRGVHVNDRNKLQVHAMGEGAGSNDKPQSFSYRSFNILSFGIFDGDRELHILAHDKSTGRKAVLRYDYYNKLEHFSLEGYLPALCDSMEKMTVCKNEKERMFLFQSSKKMKIVGYDVLIDVEDTSSHAYRTKKKPVQIELPHKDNHILSSVVMNDGSILAYVNTGMLYRFSKTTKTNARVNHQNTASRIGTLNDYDE